MKFDLPKNQSSIIKVIGVGGGGSNAVTHMFNQGIRGVDFAICNTDAQAMEISPIPTKIQLGTIGLGAGSIPSVGKESAIENIEDIKALLEINTKMLFITAGMGGGTGTGAAPVIAEVAKKLGILTVGIVTIPFSFEGRKRKIQAEQGIIELRAQVDTLLVVCNDKLRELHGDLKLSQAFSKADDILTTAAKGIAEVVTVTGYINVDFKDVKTVMENSGKAIMGSAASEGENRAIEAVKKALASPLLDDSEIVGAGNILLYIASGVEEVSMDEVTEITEHIQSEAGRNAEIIWGNGTDESLGNKISVTIIATGFDSRSRAEIENANKIIHQLDDPIAQADNILKKEQQDEPIENLPTENKVDEESLDEISIIEKNSFKPEVEECQKKEPLEKENRIVEFDLKPPTKDLIEDPQINTPLKTEITEPTLIRRVKQTEKIDEECEPDSDHGHSSVSTDNPNISEVEKRSKDRIKKLKNLSVKLKSPEEIERLEKEPAYQRKRVELSDPNPSSESVISKFSLSEPDEDESSTLKQNNSFLHDNVD
ncbi:MAG: cell division protein FtsZ [Bacteroidetes bacterium]|nr:cell division protein FtsZ [Bacteroidota bacterium]